MITITPPERPSHRYLLVDRQRVERGHGAHPPVEAGTSWIQLSDAAVIPLTAELAKGDPELAAFHEAEKDTHAYHYVSFTCSFGPARDAPFEKAWLVVTLTDRNGGGAPTAWSLAPKDAWEKVETSSSASIGAKFEILSADLGTDRKAEGRSYFLRAYRERSASPYWEFRTTDTAEIDGAYRFHVVTRMRSGAAGRGTLSLSATMLKRKYVILTSKEAAEAPPEVVFDLAS